MKPYHTIEEWRNIPGYPEYQASSEGRIRSLDREWKQLSRHGTLHIHRMKGRILRPAPSPSGHLSIVASRKNGSIRVHALVALAFHGLCPAGLEVIHLDETKQNNRPENLKYGTRSENLKRCWAAGNRKFNPVSIGARWRNRAPVA